MKLYDKSVLKKTIALLLTCIFILYPVSADDEVQTDSIEQTDNDSYFFESPNEGSYINYIKDCEQKGAKDTSDLIIQFGTEAITSFDGKPDIRAAYENAEKPVLIWEKNESFIEWTITVPQSGFYNLNVEYITIENSVDTPKRTLLIDGNLPFKEATGINFYRLWTDNGMIREKYNGDEIRPKIEEIKVWQNRYLYDASRLYTEPLRLFFVKGSHTVRFEYVRGDLAIQKLELTSPVTYKSYNELQKEYNQKDYKNANIEIRIQAEDKTVRTASNIQMGYDEDPATVPSSRDNRVLNVIGGSNWSSLGHTISWKFKVTQTGLYKLYMRSLQNYNDGLSIYRQIRIDDQVPFQEWNAYEFKYQNGWQMEELSNEKGVPYLLYLREGEHTLSMTSVLGPVTEMVNNLELDAFALSEIIQNIILITGNNPDLNFDYEIGKNAPQIIKQLKDIGDRIPSQIEQIKSFSSYKPSILNNLLILKTQIEEMINDPYLIPRKLNDINNLQMAIGDWITILRSSPLMLDYIVFAPEDQTIENGKSSIWQRIEKFIQNFIKSFYEDYDSVNKTVASDMKIEKVIDVWVARGKEWVELMKELTDDSFTSKTGIGVRYNIVPAGQLNVGGLNTLMLANASGTAPDVACGVESGLPVEFGIRGATADLTQFSDYKEIEKFFVPNVNIPFQYNNRIYALPETMSFMVQFYRTDILKKLGISPPDTWEELCTVVLPRLRQNNMNFYYMPVIQSFTPILYQNDGSYYKEDGLTCTLDSDEAYSAFIKWTELYSVYKMPMAANFFNRFRSGEMPIGISDFNLYTQLSVAAPELQGRYAIAPMIGTRKKDNTIDRTAGGGVTGILIMEQSKHKQEAWKFMKWWMSRDTQVQYGYTVESYFGVSARWATANYEAFQLMPWDSKDLEVIKKQYSYYKDMPTVLGGYFTSRHMNNAWNRIVMNKINPRDSLEKAIKDINAEMRSKQRQYLS